MEDSSQCVFYYLQQLLLRLPKNERTKKIWDETFTWVQSVTNPSHRFTCPVIHACIVYILLACFSSFSLRLVYSDQFTHSPQSLGSATVVANKLSARHLSKSEVISFLQRNAKVLQCSLLYAYFLNFPLGKLASSMAPQRLTQNCQKEQELPGCARSIQGTFSSLKKAYVWRYLY